MNEITIFPLIFILHLNDELWHQTAEDSAIHLKRCHQEIHRCGQRLAKGINRSQERIRLLQWFDRVSALAKQIHVQGKANETLIPGSHAGSWFDMLALLGKERARHAVMPGGRKQLPSFLPCIWAPSSADEGSSAKRLYTDDVRGHIQEMERLVPQFQAHFSENHQMIAEMLDMRLKIFRNADDNRAGVVEFMGSLLNL